MYLSKYRLKIGWGNKQALNDVLNGHELHRSVQSLFDAQRSEAGVLYARNFEKVSSSYIYAYSDAKGLESSDHFQLVFCREQQDVFPVGTKLRFRIVCYPSKMSKEWQRRRFLKTTDERLAWFERKAAKHGFACLSVAEIEKDEVVVKKSRDESFTFESVVFTGVLQVTDSDLFTKVLHKGIGAEKAYGMGMLMVVG